MKLKHSLIFAFLLFIAGSTNVLAQDSSAAAVTTTTTESAEPAPEESQRPDYMKIYGWVGGIIFTLIAIGVITMEVRNMNKVDEEEAAEKAEEEGAGGQS